MKSLAQAKVLLIEDNPLIMKSNSMLLKKHKIVVYEAFDAEQAMSIFMDNQDIDLILSDIDLGTEIDGTDLARILQSKRDVPLIFLSAHTDIETVSKTEGITSYGYIEKNTGEQILIASIKMAFKLHDTIQRRKQSESLYRSMFSLYPKTLYIYDLLTLDFLAVNKAALDTYGYSKEELLQMKITDIHSSDDTLHLVDIFTSISPGLVDNGIWKQRRKDGEIVKMRTLSHLISWQGYKARVVLASPVDE